MRSATANDAVISGDDHERNGCVVDDSSLREALEAAVSTPGADKVLLGSGMYNLSHGKLLPIGEIETGGAGAADAPDVLEQTGLQIIAARGTQDHDMAVV